MTKGGDVYKTKPLMELIQYTKHCHETISMSYFLFRYVVLRPPFDQHRPSLQQKKLFQSQHIITEEDAKSSKT